MSSGGGKGGGAGGSGMYDYYASFMGVVCYGPVDELVSMVIDGEAVWTPAQPVRRESASNPYVFYVEGRGRVYFYWGTSDQALRDPVSTKPSQQHPPYRHRVLAVFEQFLCGRERTSVPDVSFITRRAPAQTVIPDVYNKLDSEGQANGFAALLDFMTNPVAGMGLTNTQFNKDAWISAAQSIATNASREYISISISSKQRLKQLIKSFNGYYDTWFRQSSNGELQVGRFKEQGVIYPITIHDLVAGTDPSFEGVSPIDTDGRVILEFIDRTLAYESNHASFNNPARIDALDRTDPTEIKRPWIRRAAQAAYKVAEEGYRSTLPHHKFKLTVRSSRASQLWPGELISYYIERLELYLIARIITRTGDGTVGDTVALVVETTRVTDTVPAGGIEDIETSTGDLELSNLDYWDILQLPQDYSDKSYEVAILAGRTRGLDVGARVYCKLSSSPDYNELGIFSSWAVPVSLSAPLLATDATPLTIALLESPAPLGFSDVPTLQSPEEVADDNLLLFTTTAAGDLEVMTVSEILPSGSTDFAVSVVRGRKGSVAVDHIAGQRAYIILRSSLRSFEYQVFQDSAAAVESLDFKVTPFGGGELAITDATEKTVTLTAEV